MRVKLPSKVIELNAVVCYASNDIENKDEFIKIPSSSISSSLRLI